LSKWISDEILKRYVDFFWKQTILDAFEEYKEKVTERFMSIVRDKINNLI
jgi:hypothetical protein